MSHIKAILIDDRTLIFGSANFDCVSYYLEQEVILISKNQILAKAFKDKIAMVKYEELIILKATIKGRIAISIMYIVTLSCRILARVVKKKIHCR